MTPMLVEFTVKNYRSIRDEARLSMEATHLVGMNAEVDEATTFVAPDGRRLLRSAVLYGANASGKSNVIKALQICLAFTRLSTAGDETMLIPVDPFRLDERTSAAPTEMEITVIVGKTAYRYGFRATAQEVVEEWLYHRPAKKELRLFSRKGREITIGARFPEGERLETKTRKNALFLTVCAQFDGPVAKSVLSALQTASAYNLSDQVGAATTAGLLNLRAMVGFLGKADLGIQAFRPRTDAGDTPADMRPAEGVAKWMDAVGRSPLVVETTHRGRGLAGESVPVVFRLDREESDGTRKLFELAGFLFMDLLAGQLCVVDEIDARLHPALTRKIVELFNSSQTNPKNAQLVFATHDTHLLDPALFRRDQVWFTEKDSDGATDLYSLAEVKGVRENESFEKAYLGGRYGAVPILNRFLDAVKQSVAE